ncbi:metallopeptidase family protein [uncultured Parasphingopyxis sp.]|uniref:metallopeptidase family protein n=1 Tax=uncultured Parasphingopyxis sp. TaxID=1547918 RepID=UPI00262E9168|nr:metallopeptidase family protein [uncultured Parasphingopyxis sp.]
MTNDASLPFPADLAPDAETMEAMARKSIDALPRQFLKEMGNIVLAVEEYATREALDSVGVAHPMGLSGLYHGRPIGTKSIEESGALPDKIFLYRQPILAEAADRGIPVARLVHHVVIHEVGHHFGLSDDDMHALEEAAD